MRVGDYRRGLGRKDYRKTGDVRQASATTVIPSDRIVEAGASELGIVRITVSFKTVDSQQPVRMTFGLRT